MRHIDGEEKLVTIFGAWPSFHDAEVLSLTYERTPRGFDVTAVIHVFEATREFDEHGRYRCVKHTLITLRCGEAADVMLEGFNAQNVLSALTITQVEQSFVVTFGGCFGLEGSLRCQRVAVVDAVPWTPMNSVYAEKPNKAPEPTTMAVTPRAISGISK